MSRVFMVDLEGNIYICKHCKTHLSRDQDIISKSFQCKHGRAYLFNNVVNISVGVKEDRMMITGMHTVVDIFCVGCGSNVGWKYEFAHNTSQKYKEGKSVLELYKISGPHDSNDLIKEIDERVINWVKDKSFHHIVQKKSFPVMIASLEEIIWPNSNWKKVSEEDLPTQKDYKRGRKHYLEFVRVTHPDKAPAGYKYLAHRVFEVVKEAWNLFNDPKK